MAVTIEDIKKLRHLTSAGLSDCKNALNETNGDMEAAIEILRKKGQAIAAKREDRNAGEGCVLADCKDGFAAIVALKCETDFVAKNEGFVNVAKTLLQLAIDNKVKSVDELKAIVVNGHTVEEMVVEESGKTGEKTEIGAYEFIEGPSVVAYNHFGNKLSTIVSFNMPDVDNQVLRDVAMQVAAMNPVAVNRESVAKDVVDTEYNVAVDKSRAEQIQKAVEAALKKAGINPNLVDSEDHIASNIAKGWLTEEEAVKAREIAKSAAEAKSANMPEQMIENIAKGRVNKFFKESCLMEQEFVKDANLTIGQYLEQAAKGLVAVSFKRVNLNAD